MKQASLTQKELDIVNLYLNDKKSIREIANLYEGYGRTKINNIIEKYAQMSEENSLQVELRKLSLKYHKEIDKIQEVGELEPHNIYKAYIEIIERRKSLTKVAEELGKHRDTVKKAIIAYLKDPNKIKSFNKTLKENQSLTESKYFNNEDFNDLTDEEKRIRIFNKLNASRKRFGKPTYPEKLLDRKFNRLLNYFEERNRKITYKSDKISKSELFRMMYNHPTMLSLSLENKIKPIVDALDNRFLDFAKSSRVLKLNPAILGASLKRTSLQFKILKDTGTLVYAIEKPINLRTSPEFMYALIKIWDANERKGTPFLSTKKLYSLYNQTPGEICKKYDAKKDYGDDEYFDGR